MESDNAPAITDGARRPSLQPLPYRLPSPAATATATEANNLAATPKKRAGRKTSLRPRAFRGESNADILAAELRREIAARRDLEVRLALSEQRLAYMMTSSPMGFFDCDRLSGNAYYSPSYKEMLGYRADELPDRYQTFLDLLHPEDQHSGWLAERQPIGDGMNRFTQYFRLRHKDGTYRWIESTGIEFLDASATRTRVLGFHLDVTGAQAIGRAPAPERGAFPSAHHQQPAGIFRHRPAHGARLFSPLWKSMLGYRPEELVDTHQTWLDLLHHDDRAGHRRRAHATRLRRKPPAVQPRGAPAPQRRPLSLGPGFGHRLFRAGWTAAAHARLPRRHPRAENGRGGAGIREGVPGRHAGLHFGRRHHHRRGRLRDLPQRRRRKPLRPAQQRGRAPAHRGVLPARRRASPPSG